MEIPKEIDNIQKQIATNYWKNNHVGYFHFDSTKTLYYFIETTSDGCNLKENIDVQLRNDPICAGFIAYVISNVGKKATNELYTTYLSKVRQLYLEKRRYDPAFNPNSALIDFYEYHFLQETVLMLKSNKIYSYIQQESISLIDQYVKGYENYIKEIIKNELPETFKNRFTGLQDLKNYRFTLEGDIEVMRRQYKLLSDEGFIDCKEDSFLFRMGYDVEEANLDKIKWIKKNKKNTQPNKKSLLDYLTLVNIKELDIKQKINTIFVIPNGGEFKSNNYSYNKGQLNSKSAYHSELDKIVSQSKER